MGVLLFFLLLRPNLGHILLLILAKFDEAALFIFLFEMVWRKSKRFPFLFVI